MFQQMARDFPAIDQYTELVRHIELTEDDNMTDEDFQIVPRDQEASKVAGFFDRYIGYEQPLLSDPSVGRTTVTEVSDQEVTSRSSPSNMMELDSYPSLFDSPEKDAKQIAQGCYTEEDNMLMDADLMVLMSFATEDIPSECVTLKVQPDPKRWSVDEVRKWVSYMASKYEVEDVSKALLKLGVDGEALRQLAEQKSEICSEEIYAQLEIWWNHCRLSTGAPVQFRSSLQYRQNIPDVCESTLEEIGGWKTACLQGVAPWGKELVDLELLRNPAFGLSNSTPEFSPPRAVVDCSDSSSTDSCQSSSMGSPHQLSSDLEESVHAYQKLIRSSEIKTEPVSPKPVHHKQTIHLWQFLKELLHDDSFRHCIRWINSDSGIFKIEDSSRVAKEWGRRKNRPAMNYDKLSRSIRQYYKKGIIKKTENSKRLVYQFCSGYL